MKVGIDTETTGLNSWQGDRPFAVSMWYEDGRNTLYEWSVDPKTRKVNVDEEEKKNLNWFVNHKEDELIFFNYPFDRRMLESIGVYIGPEQIVHDGYIAAKVLNNLEPSYKLKDLCKKYLNFSDDDQIALQKQTISFRNKAKLTENERKVEEDYWAYQLFPEEPNYLKEYALKDAQRHLEWFLFAEEGLKELGLWPVYQMEMKLAPIVYDMETRGVKIDAEWTAETIKECILEAVKYENRIKKFAAKYGFKNFNVRSPKQLQTLLYNKLNLPIIKKTEKSKAPSTDTRVLEQLENKCEIVPLIFKYRGNQKGSNTLTQYLDLATIDRTNHYDVMNINRTLCIHTSADQVKARTGRFSTKKPNLQNVSDPDSSLGQEVIGARKCFGPREGFVWYAYDYVQLEVRIIASRSEEPFMLEAYELDKDIHNAIGVKISKYRDLTKEQRRKLAKHIVFTKCFGGGPKVLGQKYNVDYNIAKQILEEFAKEFPIIDQHIYSLTEEARKKGYIRNAYNRILNIEKAKAYKSVNYDIQGSAADLIKRAMLRCNERIKNIDAHMVLQIHDELVFEVNKKCATKKLIRDLKDIMEDDEGVFLTPIKVDVKKTTTSWANKQPVKM